MDIYQHFRKNEGIFIDQVFDWISQVNAQYSPYLTNFLNPREIFIADSIIRQSEDLSFKKFGGYEGAEQERILIYPSYFKAQAADFELTLFEINYSKKFSELSHGQILGSIMATGLSRSNLGDIITDGTNWQFFIDEKMNRFLKVNLERVANTSIQLEERDLNDRIKILDSWRKEELVLTSLRLDLVLARALNLSRNKAKKLIHAKKIKINWSAVEQPDIEINEFDVVSVRGFGRIKMYQQLRRTRKENLVVEVGIINRNN